LKLDPHDAHRRPPGGAKPGLTQPVSSTSAHGRTHHRLDESRQPETALSGRQQEQPHWLHHRAAALNLRRLITLGLDHTRTTWAIA
jgi:hypothetical protein